MAVLTLKNLYCIETEDWTGADEPYLRVNGSTKWSGSLNDGQTADIISRTQFNNQAVISLYDRDFGWFDGDDWLGTRRVNSSEIGFGEQQVAFTEDGANYILTYEVTAY
jgi:hypothetical protein